MTFSTISLIVMQTGWLISAYSVLARRFEKAIELAAYDLSGKVENIENAKLVDNVLFTELEDINSNAFKERYTLDTQIEIDTSQPFIIDDKLAPPPPSELLKKQQDTSIKDTTEVIIVDEKKIQKRGKKVPEKISEKAINITTYNKDGKRVVNGVEVYDKRVDKFKKAFIEAINEVTQNKPPIHDRLEAVNFDSLLYHRLNRVHINFKFVAQVRENGEVKWGVNQLDSSKRIYTNPIFTNDLVETDATLSIQFVDNIFFILLRRIGIIFYVSTFFPFVIIATYYISIKTLIRQRKLHEIKNDFINNMTHEFKTPIATISLAAESINKTQALNKPDKIPYYTGVIKEENERMLNQVENLLQIALLDKHELNLANEKVDVHEAINDAVRNMKLLLDSKEGKVIQNFKATKTDIIGDPSHIINVFTNLLDNAIKYNDTNPEIRITTKNVGEYIEVTFADNGIGMSEETMEQVFDKFYRAHTGDLHNVKGFGLGLSYVKGIIEKHKGTISVTSTLKKGSEFKVKFKNQ